MCTPCVSNFYSRENHTRLLDRAHIRMFLEEVFVIAKAENNLFFGRRRYKLWFIHTV